jgi:hypothetical protein
MGAFQLLQRHCAKVRKDLVFDELAVSLACLWRDRNRLGRCDPFAQIGGNGDLVRIDGGTVITRREQARQFNFRLLLVTAKRHVTDIPISIRIAIDIKFKTSAFRAALLN